MIIRGYKFANDDYLQICKVILFGEIGKVIIEEFF